MRIELFSGLFIDTEMDKIKMHAHLVKEANRHGYEGIDIDERYIGLADGDTALILQFEDTGLITIRKAVRDGEKWREVYNDVTPDHIKYDYYEDGRYSWLRVPIKELENMGIAERIGGDSRMRRDFAYLLRGRDMTLYVEARGWKSAKPHMILHAKHRRSQIRGYSRYDHAIACPGNAPKADYPQNSGRDEK